MKLRERERNKDVKGNSVLMVLVRLSGLDAAIPIHSMSEFTMGHTLKKSASNRRISFQFVCRGQSL